ncbi:MAG: helix-turn-helix transcriptional regulator [Halorientalis sp.]
MTRWLQSGTRRDICVLIAGADDGELPAQKLKTRLERHYDSRMDPSRFYGSLEDLQRKGFVDSHTEGLTDVYTLTEAGQRRLAAHYEWLREQLAD